MDHCDRAHAGRSGARRPADRSGDRAAAAARRSVTDRPSPAGGSSTEGPDDAGVRSEPQAACRPGASGSLVGAGPFRNSPGYDVTAGIAALLPLPRDLTPPSAMLITGPDSWTPSAPPPPFGTHPITLSS